jgi:hypothetical protein
MKKLIILIVSIMATTTFLGAGLRLGMTDAVKEKVKELDQKIGTAAAVVSDADPSIPGSGTVVFINAPLVSAACSRICPLGHLSPPGHTVPTDHIYFVLVNSWNVSEVRCPAAGYVTVINKSSDTDYAITVAFTSTFKAQFGHMTGIDAFLGASAPVLGENKMHVPVSAGQLLGTVGGPGMNGACLDFGAYDSDVLLPLINPSRYSTDYKHAVCPIDYFDIPLKTELFLKVNRTGEPAGGKIVFDQPGKLEGNWFWESQNRSNEQEAWAQRIAFVYDCVISTRPLICIGGQLLTSGSYSFQEGATLPENVTVATGKVIYRLYLTSEGDPASTTQTGTLVVQMVNDNKIRIEGTTNLAASDFTSPGSGYYYVR